MIWNQKWGNFWFKGIKIATRFKLPQNNYKIETHTSARICDFPRKHISEKISTEMLDNSRIIKERVSCYQKWGNFCYRVARMS